MTQFNYHGPFVIPFLKTRVGGRLISPQANSKAIKTFWTDVTKATKLPLETHIGCYIFGMKAGRGITPHYIGKTTANFQQEVFGLHQIHRYNTALSNAKKGTPVMFFVECRVNTSAKVTTRKEIGQLEKFLINLGFMVNPNIQNTQHVNQQPIWGIEGVVRSTKGRPSKNAALNALPFQKLFPLSPSQAYAFK
jgi:hypothetical protein